MRAILSALRNVASILFLAALFFLVTPTTSARAATSEDPVSEILRRVRTIEDRMKKIEAGQQEISEKQEKILAAVENVRIWATRR